MLLGHLYGGTPASTREVCGQVIDVLATKHRGLFHRTAEGWCSWHEFASHIVDRYGIAAGVTPSSTRDFPRPAPQPRNAALEDKRLKRLGLNRMKPWKAAFEEFRREEKNVSLQTGGLDE